MKHFCNVPITEEAIDYGLGQHPFGTIRRMIRLGRKQGIKFKLSKQGQYIDTKTKHRTIFTAEPNCLFVEINKESINNFADFWEKVNIHRCICGKKIPMSRRRCLLCEKDADTLTDSMLEAFSN